MRKAFTLAEVLITLMILGVIALLTIPAVIKNIEQHILIGQIKEAYSITTQIISRANVDYGHPSGWGRPNTIRDFTQTYILPYISYSDVCGFATENVKCFKSGNWYWLNGSLTSDAYGARNYYKIKLQNGMDLGVFLGNTYDNDIVFLYDVNGYKGPTTIGKDLFAFQLELKTGKIQTYKNHMIDNNLQTIMTTTSFGGCNKSSLWSGLGCSRAIELNGWKFPSNYPW